MRLHHGAGWLNTPSETVRSRSVMPVRGSGLTFLVLALGAACPRPSGAQAVAAPSWGFVAVRYSSALSDYIYAGYGWHAPFVMVGMLQNPRSGYTELLGGIGVRFPLGRRSTNLVAVAASKATDSWYIQLYYLPEVSLGGTTLTGTFQLSVPDQRSGVTQFAITPATVWVRLNPTVSVGATWHLEAVRLVAPHERIGPSLRLAVPRGALALFFLKGIRNYRDEARAAVTLSY